MAWATFYDCLRRVTSSGKKAGKTKLATIDYVRYGAPGAIRTRDPRLRRAVLYPAELRAQLTEVE